MNESQDTDAQIWERVTAALEKDDRTTDAAIDVVSEQGLVTLTGRVDSHQVRQAAEEIAAGQAGVLDVINDLAIASKEDEGVLDTPWAAEAAAYETRAPYIPNLNGDEDQE